MKKPQVLERYGRVTLLRNLHGEVIYELAIDPDVVRFDFAIEQILQDDNIEEIMYNGADRPIAVFHHKYGMCNTNLLYDEKAAMDFVHDVADFNKKSLDEANPILDGVLPDGNRINLTIPPASLSISVTIRKFKRAVLTVLDMIKDKSVTTEIAAYLWTCISRLGFPANILFVGGAATGKTTTLNAFSMFIEQRERVISIEDTPELRLRQLNVVRMISDHQKGIDMDVLLRNGLRMRPDRIIVGEVRGTEALTLFSAMNTGHDGCIGTLHANSSKECVSRITNPPMNVPMTMLGALNLVVVLRKHPSGVRHIQEISEIAGSDSDTVRFNTVFQWDPTRHQCFRTGVPSRLKAKFAEESGLKITDIDTIINNRKHELEELVKGNAREHELLAAINKSQ